MELHVQNYLRIIDLRYNYSSSEFFMSNCFNLDITLKFKIRLKVFMYQEAF